jgi:hypothetical protein
MVRYALCVLVQVGDASAGRSGATPAVVEVRRMPTLGRAVQGWCTGTTVTCKTILAVFVWLAVFRFAWRVSSWFEKAIWS